MTVALSAGAAGAASGRPTAQQWVSAPHQTARQRFGNHRTFQPNCAVNVWASNLGGAVVNGYAGNNPNPCITLNGSTSGLPFYAPFGLATDGAGNLYVADVDNGRVVVFDSSGGYLNTLTMNANMQPYSVCVSPAGVVGVVDRGAAIQTETSSSSPTIRIRRRPERQPAC